MKIAVDLPFTSPDGCTCCNRKPATTTLPVSSAAGPLPFRYCAPCAQHAARSKLALGLAIVVGALLAAGMGYMGRHRMGTEALIVACAVVGGVATVLSYLGGVRVIAPRASAACTSNGHAVSAFIAPGSVGLLTCSNDAFGRDLASVNPGSNILGG